MWFLVTLRVLSQLSHTCVCRHIPTHSPTHIYTDTIAPKVRTLRSLASSHVFPPRIRCQLGLSLALKIQVKLYSVCHIHFPNSHDLWKSKALLNISENSGEQWGDVPFVSSLASELKGTG